MRATETPCLDAAETTVVSAAPQVRDAGQRHEGAARARELTDKLTVTGAGALHADRRTSSSSGRSRPTAASRAPARRSGRARCARPATARTRPTPVTVEQGRLLHLPRVDRGGAADGRLHRQVRRHLRDVARDRGAAGRHASVSDDVVDPGARDLRPGHASPASAAPRRRSASSSSGRSPRGGDQVHRHAVRARARSYAKGDGTVRTPAGAARGRGLLHLPRAPRRHRPDRRDDDRVRRSSPRRRSRGRSIITGRNDVTRPPSLGGGRSAPRRRACASRASASTRRSSRPGST